MPYPNDNKFVIMGQGKIVLQKDIPKAGSNFLVSVVRFRPGPPKSNNALLLAGHFLLVL